MRSVIYLSVALLLGSAVHDRPLVGQAPPARGVAPRSLASGGAMMAGIELDGEQEAAIRGANKAFRVRYTDLRAGRHGVLTPLEVAAVDRLLRDRNMAIYRTLTPDQQATWRKNAQALLLNGRRDLWELYAPQ